MAGLDGGDAGWPEGQVCFPVERDVAARLTVLSGGGGAMEGLAGVAAARVVERLSRLYPDVVARAVGDVLRGDAVLPPGRFGPVLGGAGAPESGSGLGAAGVGMDPDGVPAGNDLNHLVALVRGGVEDLRPGMAVTPQAVLDAWVILPEANQRLGPVGQARAIADRLVNDGQPLGLPGGARGPTAGDRTWGGSEAAWAGDAAARIVTLIAGLRARSGAPEMPQPGLKQAVQRALQDGDLPGLHSELAVALEGSGAARHLNHLFDAILAQELGDDVAAEGVARARSSLPERDLLPQEMGELDRAFWDLVEADDRRDSESISRVLASVAGVPEARSGIDELIGWAEELQGSGYVQDRLMQRLASLLPTVGAMLGEGVGGEEAWRQALQLFAVDHQWMGVAPVRSAWPGREMVLRVLDRSDLERLYRGDRLAGALAGGGALHPGQWEAARGTGRRVPYQVWTRQRQRVMEVRRLGQDPGTGQPLVTELAVRVVVAVDSQGYVSPGEGVDAQELVSARLLDGVDYYLNFQHRLPDGSQLHVRVELAGPGEDEAGQGEGRLPAAPIVLPAWQGSMALYARLFALDVLGLDVDNPGADDFPVTMFDRDLLQRGPEWDPDAAAYRYWDPFDSWEPVTDKVVSADGLPVAPLTGFHDWHMESLWGLMSSAWDLKPSREVGPSGQYQWRRVAERADRVHVASLPAGLITSLLNRQFPEISRDSGFERAWAGDIHAAHRAAILRRTTTWARMDWELSRSLDEFIGQLYLGVGLERHLPGAEMRVQRDNPREEGFWPTVGEMVRELYRVWGTLAVRLGAWGDGTVAGAGRILRRLVGAEGLGGELSPELLIGLLVLFWGLPDEVLQSQDLPLQELALVAASVVGWPEDSLLEGMVATAAARIGGLAPLVLMPALRREGAALRGLRIVEVHQRAREMGVSLDNPQAARQFEYVNEEARQARPLGQLAEYWTGDGDLPQLGASVLVAAARRDIQGILDVAAWVTGHDQPADGPRVFSRAVGLIESLAPWLYDPRGSVFSRPRLAMAALLLRWAHDLGVLPLGGGAAPDPDLMRSFEITISTVVDFGNPPGTVSLRYGDDAGPWRARDALAGRLFGGSAGLRWALAEALLAGAAWELALEAGAAGTEDFLLDDWIEAAATVVTGSSAGDVSSAVGLISGVPGWAFGSVIRSGHYGDQLQRSVAVVRLLGVARHVGLWQPGGPPPGEADMHALELVAWLADADGGFGDADIIASLTSDYARAGLDAPLDLARLARDLDGNRALGDYSPERLELLGQVAAALGGHQQARQALEQDQPAGWHAALGRLSRELWGIAVDDDPRPDGLPLPGTARLQDVTSLGELLDHLERLANHPYDSPPYGGRDLPQPGAGHQRPGQHPGYDSPPSYDSSLDYDRPPDDAELHQAQLAWTRAEEAVRAAEEQAGGAETSSGPPAGLVALRHEADLARLRYLTVAVNGLRQSRRLPTVTTSDVLQASDGVHARNDRDLILAIAAALQDPAPHPQEHGAPRGGHNTIAYRAITSGPMSSALATLAVAAWHRGDAARARALSRLARTWAPRRQPRPPATPRRAPLAPAGGRPEDHLATRLPSPQTVAPVQGAVQAPAALRVSLADPGTVDQAARPR